MLERSHLGCDCSSASRNGQDGIPARKVGGATSSASAGKILYWRAINRVDVDDARYLDLEQLGAGGAGLRVPGSGGGAAPAKPVSRPVPGT